MRTELGRQMICISQQTKHQHLQSESGGHKKLISELRFYCFILLLLIHIVRETTPVQPISSNLWTEILHAILQGLFLLS